MSLLRWLAAMDGRPARVDGPRHFEKQSCNPSEVPFEPARHGLGDGQQATLASMWGSLADAYARLGLQGLLETWLLPEYEAVGLDENEAKNVTGRSLVWMDRIADFGHRFILPQHLCPTCCQHGAARLKLLVARNPFERLVSYFRLKWLGSPTKVHNRWEDFPVFVQYVASRQRVVFTRVGIVCKYTLM
ncbi:unnamed protein product [Polarella glacialis]|uniref:Uncharacterized protein n=1 Tax=Polarella glacialis TaxID=89957 RepID=A0A813FJT9_POLGL|nr:unnamed protein product [Polarella glacialis]